MEIIKSRQINKYVYQLSEYISETLAINAYLVVGEEKAAIIDTGYGMSGDLDKKIAEITNKPVICLLTHADPDHAGAAALFDEIYMSEIERPLLEGGSINPMVRFQTCKTMAGDPKRVEYFKENMVQAKTFDFKPIENGQVFDLGGLKLQAILFPGHTKGSMCFWNKENNFCIAGDAIANGNSPVLFFKKCTSLVEYKENFLKFFDIVGNDCEIYTGHNEDKLSKQLLTEIPILVDEILAGNTMEDKPYTPPFLEKPSPDASVFTKLASAVVSRVVSKKELGDAIPLEHTAEGFVASIKYNANNILKK